MEFLSGSDDIQLSSLFSSVKYLKGVGPRRAKLLNKLGIYTIFDLLTYYPREYQDRTRIQSISELKIGQKGLICGEIQARDVINVNRKLGMFRAAITDKTGVIYVNQFRTISYKYDVFKKLKELFTVGKKIMVYGKVDFGYGIKQINIEDYKILNSDINNETNDFLGLISVYSITEGIESSFVRKIIKQALEKYSCCLKDILPENIISKHNFLTYQNAIEQIHFPENFYLKEQSRKRLAYEEFLLLELAMNISKRQAQEVKKIQNYTVKKTLLTPFKQNLHFEFTNSQKKVIKEIFNDLQKPSSMNRLLLGDVGSGKTVVALSAILLAIENGYQTTFLAPTEILAEQHFYSIKNFVKNLNVRITLLTSTTSLKDREKIVEEISQGNIDLVIGTHAILEEDIKFKNLCLIVIDEQHKFGVAQRHKLLKKGCVNYRKTSPDVLIMTATPIPRTLGLTLYGNLDISVIDELPPNRQPITTKYEDEKIVYEFVKNEIRKGFQCYIVYPLVNESDKLELKSAIKEWEKLQKEVFSEFKVGLLHGQMPGKQKEQVMIDFYNKKFDILISTTVIEVGIDVPNVTVIVIHHADRFGLATLHQLRGRIGRGEHPGTCFLLGNPKTDEAKKRFDILLKTTDGFKIAQADLEIRGPGEFFGTEQHGIFQFKIGDLIHDINLIQKAREDAIELLNKDRFLSSFQHRLLREALIKKYEGKFTLPNIR